jgi:protoporphyrinogen IX oxidase
MMIAMKTALVWLHVSSNLVWIGSILAVAALLSGSAERIAADKQTGELASLIYRRLATPAFVISFVSAVTRVSLDANYYFVQHHWMHGKLVFAVAVIGLHHVLGAKAKKAADGKQPKNAVLLAGLLAACAFAAAFFALVRVPD